jgi:FMN-dependent NADH-azoreductase
MGKKILGIVGSYRKGGVIDTLVTEVLSSAEEQGAQTTKIYLVDQHIEFCTNCRKCTQDAGSEPGKCIHQDDMESILARFRDSDAIVLGAPVNFFNVNAVTRKFMERLACFSYWPWGAKGPQMRTESKVKKAVLITSMAMPALLGRIFTGALRALRIAATTMGAKPVASIIVGMVAQKERPSVPEDAIRKAREAGRRLVTG